MLDKIITFILEHFFIFLLLYLITAFLVIEKNDLYHPEPDNEVSKYVEEKREKFIQSIKASLMDEAYKYSIDLFE